MFGRLASPRDKALEPPWLSDAAALGQSVRETNASPGMVIDELVPLLREANQIEADLAEDYAREADAIAVGHIPRNWTSIARAVEDTSVSSLDGALAQCGFGHRPFETLERNLRALEAALPTPASKLAASERPHLRPDSRTLNRLRRHWVLLSEHFGRALDSATQTVLREAARSGQVALANRVAFELL
jgi:hypothetical protein